MSYYHISAFKNRIRKVKYGYNEIREELCPEDREKMDKLMAKL